MTADFGLVRDERGRLSPRIVELQAFPSVFGYQTVLCDEYRDVYHLDSSLDFLLGGRSEDSFWRLMGQVILNGHNPENVVLTEVDPWHQKTLADFLVTADRLKIQIVDIAQLVLLGNKLHYRRKYGVLVPIHRIYNRAIVDEMVRKDLKTAFRLTDDLEVEWAGHPNWFFRLSKFSLPYLRHECVPKTWFLDRVDQMPKDLENYVVKPLFSFAGLGVIINLKPEDIAAIPREQRSQYILQERMHFEPVVETPFGGNKAEVRIMYIWLDELLPVMTIIRMSRGMMMGVDHNRNMEWVGSSAGFYT